MLNITTYDNSNNYYLQCQQKFAILLIMIKAIYDSRDARKKINRLSRSALPGAVRDSLNNMARGAAQHARAKTIPRYFKIRNKWTKGSLVPSPGKNYGLIPSTKTDIAKMFSVFGSRQPYLLQQDIGFRKRSPSIPIYRTSRAGGTFGGSVRPSMRLKKLQTNMRTYRDVKNKARTRKGKTYAMLSISARQNYKGSFFLNVPGTFKRGVWKIKKKASFQSGVPQMTFLRSQKKENPTYKKRPWFTETATFFQKDSTYDYYWKQSVKKHVDPVFRK